MTDSEALVDELNTKFEVSKEKEESFLSSIDVQQTGSPATQSRPSRQRAVGVTPVPNYVGPKNIPNFVVPPFATTWGIVCQADDLQTLYHLLYDSSAHSMSFHFTGSVGLLPSSTLITPVGSTTHSS